MAGSQSDDEKGTAQRVKDFAYEKTPEKFKNASDFQIRLRTGTVYVIICIASILAGDVPTMLFLAATAGICSAEFFYMLRSDAKMPNEWIGVVGAAYLPIAAFFFGLRGIVAGALLLMLALTLWYVFWSRARMQDVGVSLFGALYTGMQLACIMLVRTTFPGTDGGLLVLLLFASIWANDAFAYLVGRKFGKHKLAPRTSPNKSWEGFFGGLAGGVAVWFLVGQIPSVHIDPLQTFVLGVACGLAGVLGDLCESRIKRSVGFKDSGTMMPGHGGLFDRCDSLMTTATAAFVLLVLFGCINPVL